MTIYPGNNKINSIHLERRAIVYVRQSTEKQARFNTESQRLQYALVNKAKAYGWQKIDVIDTDLGSSAGIGAADRQGFDQLIATVAKGEAGIVLSSEVSLPCGRRPLNSTVSIIRGSLAVKEQTHVPRYPDV